MIALSSIKRGFIGVEDQQYCYIKIGCVLNVGSSKYSDQCRERCGWVQSQSCNCVESAPSKEMLEGDVMVVTVDMFLDRIRGYQYYIENDCYTRVHAWNWAYVVYV
jgi:hypothetical protein